MVMHQYFVYMIECCDSTIYVGVTNDVERRFRDHCDGRDPNSYTAKRRPLKLIYVEHFQWIQYAISREKQLKGWSAAKKRALIMNDEAILHQLARCKNASTHTRERSQE